MPLSEHRFVKVFGRSFPFFFAVFHYDNSVRDGFRFGYVVRNEDAGKAFFLLAFADIGCEFFPKRRVER